MRLARVAAVALIPPLLLTLLAALVAAQATDPRRRTAPPEGLRENVPQLYALVGADVVVRPGETIEDATIVLKDGKITAVGADVEVPDGALEIDMIGRRVYAGFIDAFAELPREQSSLAGESGAANYWNANVTPQIDAARVLATSGATHENLRKAGFVARLYAPGAGVIKGRAALVNLSKDASGESAVLRSNIGMATQLTPDRGGTRGYPGSPMGAVSLARQAMYDAQWYAQAQQAVADDPSLARPERNDALAALQPVLDGELPLWIAAGDELYALRADRFGKEFEVDVVVVGSGDEYRRADLVAATGRKLVLPINFPKPPDVTTPERADAATLAALMDWDLSPSNPAMMKDNNVTFAFTTNGLRRPDREFHPNLKKAIKRGLSADDALAALTTEAATLVGAEAMLGTVEAGKMASLVIADGDLFDPKGKAKIVEVWADGSREILHRDPTFDPKATWQVVEGDSFRIFERRGRLTGSWTPGTSDEEPATQPTTQPATQPSTQPTTKPKNLALKNVASSADGLSFTVNAKPFGQSGVASVSLTRLGDKLFGQVLLPDGTRETITVTKSEAATTQPDDEGEGDTIDAEPAVTDGDDREAAEDVPVESQQTEDEPGTATMAEEPDGEEPEGEAVEIETTPTTGPTTVAAADKKDEPLYPVNYPLGAYGRESADVAETTNFDIVNATVWTSGEAGIIENGVIAIRDGKIAGVWSSRDFELQSQVQPSETEIDATGKHITPGLIDCHTHIATDGGVNEATQSVTCEVRIGDFVDPNDIDLYRQLAGGVTSANILHGSANPIGGQNQVIKFRWGVGPEELKFEEAPEGVKFALGENVKRVGSNRYPNTRMGVQEIFADSFRAAQDYQRAKTDFEANGGLPVRRDLELDALSEMLDGSRLVHTHSYRQDEILATLRTFEEFGITMASLQHILEGYKVAKEMAEHGVGGSTFSDWWAYKFEVYDAIPYNGAIMHREGVVVSFNSDDGELARRLNTEAAKAVKYGGVPPEEALKFVTLNPAKQLKIDDMVGSLEPGKHADLVVWSADPLSSYAVAEQTWVDGRKYFDRAEDAKLQEQVREMRAKLIQRILGSGESPAAPGEGTAGARPGDQWADTDIYCHGQHDHGTLGHGEAKE